MALRRGFKTEANGYAREMRSELGLAPHDPLCPWTLAAYLNYTVKSLSEYRAAHPEGVSYLLSSRGQKEFSALAFYGREFSLIVHNDAHHPRRQTANIAHEIAHGLLLHRPAPLASANGARFFSREQEDEANWLGPALLVSEEAALFIAETGLSFAAACSSYKVSNDLLQMRLRVTNAFVRVARRRAA
jgi:Zn-dependent peptidase ImmA (M78 family)